MRNTLLSKIEKLPKVAGIYIITNTQNGKVYIGQSVNMYQRNRSRLFRLQRGTLSKKSTHLQAAWNKYGPESFVFDVLLLCPEDQCDCWEDHYIETFKSWQRERGYNVMKQAHGPGRISEETRKKMSEAAKGRVCSEEARRRMSEAKLGTKRELPRPPASLETRRRMSEAAKGRSPSAETRARLSEAGKARGARTDEEKKAISAKLKGHVVSAETRAKISAALRATR